MPLRHIERIEYSLEPRGVSKEDFDLSVEVTAQGLSASTTQVGLTGMVTLRGGEQVPFEASIANLQWAWETGAYYKKAWKGDQLHFKEKTWAVDVGNVEAETKLSEAVEAELVYTIIKNINDFKKKYEKGH